MFWEGRLVCVIGCIHDKHILRVKELCNHGNARSGSEPFAAVFVNVFFLLLGKLVQR